MVDAQTSSSRHRVVARRTRSTRRISRSLAFVTVSASLLAFFVAAGAPTPLLPIYERNWGFDPSLLTVAFGVYAFGLILTLLVAGSLSDFIGRRPLLIGALAVELASVVVFLFAPSIGWLIFGRVLQGIATGAASSTFGAAIVELAPEGRKRLGAVMTSLMTTGGLGIGALFSGLIALLIPQSAALVVWVVLVVIMASGTAFAVFTPETSAQRPGALRSLVPRVTVPATVRRLFASTSPTIVALFLETALFLGLVPTILGSVFAISTPIIGGVVNFLMFGLATATAASAGSVQPRRLKIFGNIGMVIGMALFVGAIATTGIGLVWASAAIAGAGMGAAFSGSTRGLIGEVQPHQRASLLAALFTVAYVTFGVSAIIAGFIASAIGVKSMAVGFGIVVIVIALLGLVLTVGLRGRVRVGHGRTVRTAIK